MIITPDSKSSKIPGKLGKTLYPSGQPTPSVTDKLIQAMEAAKAEHSAADLLKGYLSVGKK